MVRKYFLFPEKKAPNTPRLQEWCFNVTFWRMYKLQKQRTNGKSLSKKHTVSHRCFLSLPLLSHTLRLRNLIIRVFSLWTKTCKKCQKLNLRRFSGIIYMVYVKHSKQPNLLVVLWGCPLLSIVCMRGLGPWFIKFLLMLTDYHQCLTQLVSIPPQRCLEHLEWKVSDKHQALIVTCGKWKIVETEQGSRSSQQVMK